MILLIIQNTRQHTKIVAILFKNLYLNKMKKENSIKVRFIQ